MIYSFIHSHICWIFASYVKDLKTDQGKEKQDIYLSQDLAEVSLKNNNHPPTPKKTYEILRKRETEFVWEPENGPLRDLHHIMCLVGMPHALDLWDYLINLL